MKIPTKQIQILKIIGEPYYKNNKWRLDIECVMVWLYEKGISYVSHPDFNSLKKLKTGDLIDVETV